MKIYKKKAVLSILVIAGLISTFGSVMSLGSGKRVAAALYDEDHKNQAGQNNGATAQTYGGSKVWYNPGTRDYVDTLVAPPGQSFSNGQTTMSVPVGVDWCTTYMDSYGNRHVVMDESSDEFQSWAHDNGVPSETKIHTEERLEVWLAVGPKDPVTGQYPMQRFDYSRDDYEELMRDNDRQRELGVTYMSEPNKLYGQTVDGTITHGADSEPMVTPVPLPTEIPDITGTPIPPIEVEGDDYDYTTNPIATDCYVTEYIPCTRGGQTSAPGCLWFSPYYGESRTYSTGDTYSSFVNEEGVTVNVTVHHYTVVTDYYYCDCKHTPYYYCDGYCTIGFIDDRYPHLHWDVCDCMLTPGMKTSDGEEDYCSFVPYVEYNPNYGMATSYIERTSAAFDLATAMWYPVTLPYNIWNNKGTHFTDWSLLLSKQYDKTKHMMITKNQKLGERSPGDSTGTLELSTVYTAYAQWKPNEYIINYDYNAENCLYPEELVKNNEWLVQEEKQDSKRVTYYYPYYDSTWDLRNYFNEVDAMGNVVSPKTDIYGDTLGVYGKYPLPKMRGYSFKGWSYTESMSTKPTVMFLEKFDRGGVTQYFAEGDGTVQIQENGTKDNYIRESDKYIVDGDSTVYACWEPERYKVIFDYNEDWKRPKSLRDEVVNLGVSDTDYAFGDYYTKLPVPDKTGYIFLGWYMDEYIDEVRKENGVIIKRTNGYCEECGYACEKHRIKEGISLVVTAENHTLHAAWKQKEVYLVESDSLTGEELATRIIRYDDFYGDYYTEQRYETDNKLYVEWLINYENGVRLMDARFHEVKSGVDVYYDNMAVSVFKNNMLDVKNYEDYSDFEINGCRALKCLAGDTGNYAHSDSYDFGGWSFDYRGLIAQRYLALNGDRMNSAGVVVKDTNEQGYGDREIFQIRKPKSSEITLDYCLKFYHGWQFEREDWANSSPDFMYENGNKASGKLVTAIRVEQDSTFGNLPTPEREGYVFIGWSTGKINCTNDPSDCEGPVSRDCSTGMYYNGDENMMVDSSYNVVLSECQDRTLYAVWKQKDVAVHLDYNQDYDPMQDSHYCK